AAIHLWEVANGNERRRIAGYEGGVHSLTFSRDGKVLISDGRDGTILVTDPARGVEIRRFGDGIVDSKITVTAMALSSDGRVLAARGYAHVTVSDAPIGKPIRQLRPD